MYTACDVSGLNHRIYAVSPLQEEKPKLVYSVAEGAVLLLRLTGENFFVVTNNENLIEL